MEHVRLYLMHINKKRVCGSEVCRRLCRCIYLPPEASMKNRTFIK